MSEQIPERAEPAELGRLSFWRDPCAIGDHQAQEGVARLELRAQAESEIAAREDYVGLLGVGPGERVLDVGCGSGAVTRTLATRVGPDGRAIGCDASISMLELARRLADNTKFGAEIEFKEGDCRALPFPDASFDAVVAATTLSHVPGAEQALTEMVRVTRPGGRVGIFDVDGDMCLLTHPDREVTRKIVAAFSDQMWVNSWLMRELPVRLADLGLININTRAFMPLEATGYYAQRAERAAEAAARLGVITSDEREGWLHLLRLQISAKRFLGGQLHLFVWGTRPHHE